MFRSVSLVKFSANVKTKWSTHVCASFATKVEVQDTNRLKYLKNVKTDYDAKPADWDSAKPFDEIPGPKPVPVLGNLWRFLPGIGKMGNLDPLQQQRYLNDTFGDIVKLSDIKIRRNMVMLFNPDDIEKSFRNEGLFPMREAISSLEYYKRHIRPDVFGESIGLLNSRGEDWYRQRSVVNPVMMQPRSAQMYIDSMDLVAQDFISKMKQLVKVSPKGEMPETFFNELNKWALESVCVIAMNKRLGLLDDSKITVEAEKFIKNILAFFEGIYALDVRPSLWKWISTPAFKQQVKTVDEIVNFAMRHVREEADKIKQNKEDKAASEMSILERLLQKDEKIAFTMTFDLLTAGVDTTSRIVAAALYFLAKNEEVQEKFRKELKQHLPTPDTLITKESLNKMIYLRAIIKETARIAPIGIGNLRTSVKDLVFSGYQVPKGTDIMTSHLILCKMDKYFPQANKFIPERWLRDEQHEFSNKDVNPFIYQPFGFGPRSCVGKRLASLEIEVILAKVIRNFHLEWPHEDMKWTINLLYGVGSPLKFHVTPIKS